MKKLFTFKFLLLPIVLLVSILPNIGYSQIAAWDFTGENQLATSAAKIYNANLDTSNLLTRGAGAAASAGSNSFRTVGFKNDGISTANTDYFQFTLSASTGYTLSLSTIDAKFAGTTSFAVSPGVSSQFAYSLDGTTFNLIGSPTITVGTPATLPTINLSSIVALQNLPASTTVTFRYYASGQTASGGWGFNSSAAGVYGLAIGGAITAAGADVTPPAVNTFTPANGATNVAINTNLQIAFNENIQKGTAGNIVVKKFSDSSVVQTIPITDAAVTVSANIATITISTLANSTTYFIELDSASFKDIAGNSFAGIKGSTTWKFTTQSADVTPPTVTSFSPANNATGVAVNTSLQIVFNENIQKGTTGNIVVKKLSDNSVVQTIAVTSSSVTVNNVTATITINTLAYSTAYYIEVDAGAFQDISGNNFAGISGNATWSFTTAAQPTAGIIGKNYDFNTCSSYLNDGFRQYSVTGPNQFWSCTNFGRTYSGTGTSLDSAIQMNGYASGNQINEDWFISPPYNLTGANSPALKFYTRTKFAGPDLVLKVSTNYSGSGDPRLATWTNLNGKFPVANTDIWTLSDSIDLAPYSVPNVYLAWVYTSTSSAAQRTTLDDIKVYLGCTPPASQPTSLNLTSTITSVTGSFTAAAAPADAFLVIRSTSPALTVQPSPGNAYAGDDVIGNGTVVSVGNNLSFTINNLNPSTQYYFFVYAYVAAQSCYNISNPLTGNVTTASSPNCTPPTVQATNLNGTVTGSSINLTYTRGNGDNILIVAKKGGAVNQNPIVGVNYPAGSEIGSGNFVIYNGPAANFSYTGLTQNSTYYFALYEYFNTNYCYNLTPLTGNFTTSCITPVNVSSLNAAAGNTQVSLTWTNPTASCFDEVLVVASNVPITGQGSNYTGSANTTYTTPNQVVFRGIGNAVTITGLANATSYYFKVFTKIGSTYSSGVSISATPFDPASGFVYLYGNLHSHSSYSDGNKDTPSKKPIDDYIYARDANCMDFLGISEHNHSQAGMNIANYPKGYADANAINGVVSPTTGNSIITLWGMEWGVISGGGHVVTYGFDDKLIGWESGNYDIFCAKNDYASLFNIINGQPNAFATLAHPNLDTVRLTSDFGNLAYTPYSTSADNAIVGTAIESGPAFSTDTTYSNFPFALGYFEYYKIMLAKGYHLGASMDGDNHNLTFGKQSTNRLVVLAASRTRTDLVAAMKAMRFYASNDCNIKVDYKIYSNVMGSSLSHAGVPNITINVTDPDITDIVDSVYIFGGKIGDPAPAQPIKKYYNTASVTFNSTDAENIQPNNSDWYYFSVIKQQDGNRVVTSPIWYSRNDAATLITDNFRTKQNGNWNDAATWESSADGKTWNPATLTPDFNSNTITVRHNINITSSLTIDQTTINSPDTVFVNPGVVLIVNDGAGTDLDINLGGNLTIRSTAAGTGSIGNSTGTIFNPGVTVERYIPANANRAWRLLSVPTSYTQTINGAWQNGQSGKVAGPAGKGTMISGGNFANPGAFDYTTSGSSMLTYDQNNNSFVSISSTSNQIATDNGYMLFVRGDRTATPTNGIITATTLSTSGNIKQGNYPSSPLSVSANKFGLIGNPYASQIDFRLVTKTGGIDSTFYVWDPKLAGSFGVGAYKTLTRSGTDYIIVPGGGIMNTIESGQAFFVHATSTTGNISFTENAKSNGNTNVFRIVSTPASSLITNLYSVDASGEALTDGTMHLFDNSYSNQIDGKDALKLTNFGLNLGIISDNKTLVVEKRQPLTSSDVITFSLTNAKPQQYRFEFVAKGLDQTGLTGYLVDNYLKTTTPVHLNGTTSVNFSINADAGSSATDRFYITFAKPVAIVSNAFPSIVVYPNPVTNGNIKLQFTNMPHGDYQVRILNNLGQLISAKQINHTRGTGTELLQIKGITKGIYQVEINKPDNTKIIQKVIND